jgi:integrase
MRLGELVFLQPRDFVEIKGNLVIDLDTPNVVAGRERKRPLKNPTSYRIVAIHSLLHQVGFVDWARSQTTWVFDAFHSTQDPADAAQKRMGYWMDRLGIHETQSNVFHSLRHNAKAWMRLHVPERVADSQCGHAPTGEGARYGFKKLVPEEVRRLEKIPLPNEIDLSPFFSR